MASLESIWIYYLLGSLILASVGGSIFAILGMSQGDSIYYNVLQILPPGITILLSITFHLLIIVEIRSTEGPLMLQLLINPLILLICFTPYTLLDLVFPSVSNGIWQCFAIVAYYSQGLLHSLTFGLGKALTDYVTSD